MMNEIRFTFRENDIHILHHDRDRGRGRGPDQGQDRDIDTDRDLDRILDHDHDHDHIYNHNHDHDRDLTRHQIQDLLRNLKVKNIQNRNLLNLIHIPIPIPVPIPIPIQGQDQGHLHHQNLNRSPDRDRDRDRDPGRDRDVVSIIRDRMSGIIGKTEIEIGTETVASTRMDDRRLHRPLHPMRHHRLLVHPHRQIGMEQGHLQIIK